jgi:hypothetical protein
VKEFFYCEFGISGADRDACQRERERARWVAREWRLLVHFLDSPEQGLLAIPLFTDIEEEGGGTMVAPGGIREVG